MISATAKFPKTARLLTRQDFRFRPFSRFYSENFTFIYTTAGSARVGISISKKVLRQASSRNRIRRLIREAFRLQRDRFDGLDVHVIGRDPLTKSWTKLTRSAMEGELGRLLETVRGHHA